MSNKTKSNIVTSYFFYMFCRWCREECVKVFPGYMTDHMWSKWVRCTTPSSSGAAERFYADLDEGNREKIVARACELYSGSSEIDKC